MPPSKKRMTSQTPIIKCVSESPANQSIHVLPHLQYCLLIQVKNISPCLAQLHHDNVRLHPLYDAAHNYQYLCHYYAYQHLQRYVLTTLLGEMSSSYQVYLSTRAGRHQHLSWQLSGTEQYAGTPAYLTSVWQVWLCNPLPLGWQSSRRNSSDIVLGRFILVIVTQNTATYFHICDLSRAEVSCTKLLCWVYFSLVRRTVFCGSFNCRFLIK